jgi:hypothetical protein
MQKDKVMTKNFRILTFIASFLTILTQSITHTMEKKKPTKEQTEEKEKEFGQLLEKEQKEGGQEQAIRQALIEGIRFTPLAARYLTNYPKRAILNLFFELGADLDFITTGDYLVSSVPSKRAFTARRALIRWLVDHGYKLKSKENILYFSPLLLSSLLYASTQVSEKTMYRLVGVLSGGGVHKVLSRKSKQTYRTSPVSFITRQ